MVRINEGWFKFYRSISHHWVSTDAEALAFWVLLLAEAAIKPMKILFRGRLINLLPGQLLFQRPQWEARYNINGSKLYRLLEKFQREGMIAVQPAGRMYSLITIVNWTVYQTKGAVYPSKKIEQVIEQVGQQELCGLEGDARQENEQQMNNKRTTIYKESKKVRNKEYTEYTQAIQESRHSYTSQSLDLIDRYIDILRCTRRSNKIAESVISQIYENMRKYPEIVVQYACQTVIGNPALHSKKENYFYGIMRNTTVEEAEYRMKKGAQSDGKTVKSTGSGYDTGKIMYNGTTGSGENIDF